MAFITGFMYTGILVTLCCHSATLVYGSTTSSPTALDFTGLSTPVPQSLDFTACCRNENVTAGCLSVCNISHAATLSPSQLIASCSSDPMDIQRLLNCGLNGQNSTGCCLSKNVTDICLDLCKGNTPANLNAAHLACVGQIVDILTCQHVGLGTATPLQHSMTTSHPSVSSSMSLSTPVPPSLDFTACCRNENVTAGCLSVCNISHAATLSPSQLIASCSSDAMDIQRLLNCGLNGQNSTGCCLSKNVTGICLDLCKGNTPANLNAAHLACVGQIVDILTCQHVGLGTATPLQHSMTTSHPSVSSSMSLSTPVPPSLDFTACCRNENVTAGCLSVCNISHAATLSPSQLIASCSSDAMDIQRLLNCGLNGQNSTGCCLSKNVTDICLDLCRGNTPANLNAAHLACVGQIVDILTCQHVGLGTASPLQHSMTTSHPSVSSSMSLSTPVPPSLDFTACCRNENVTAGCLSVCNISHAATLSPSQLIASCSSDAMDIQRLLNCGLNGQNSTGCCLSKNVTDICLDLCRGNTPANLNAAHLACVGQIVDILTCQHVGLGTASPLQHSMTTSHPSVSSSMSLSTPVPPSLDFTACCRNENVTAGCLSVCNISHAATLSPSQLIASCSSDAMDIQRLLNCGLNGQNSTGCCLSKNVTDICLDLCRGNTPANLNAAHLACVGQIVDILTCQHVGLGTATPLQHSMTSSHPSVSSSMSLSTPVPPSLDFTACCRHENVTAGCLSVCNISHAATLSPSQLIASCSSDAMDIQRLLNCGLNGQNSTGCCLSKNVTDICLDLCRGNTPANLNAAHLTCVGQIVDILTCQHVGLGTATPLQHSMTTSHPNVSSSISTATPLQHSLTTSHPNVSSSISLSTPVPQSLDFTGRYYTFIDLVGERCKDLFTQACCRHENVTAGCLSVCNISHAATLSPLQLIASCSSDAMDIQRLLNCGLNGQNSTGCCLSKNVTGICLDLCTGNTPANLNAAHLTCVGQIVDILTCQHIGLGTATPLQHSITTSHPSVSSSISTATSSQHHSSTSQPSVSVSTTSPPLATFPCDSACYSACTALNEITDADHCWAYDTYGVIKTTFRASLTDSQRDALNELEAMTGVWQTTADLRSCDSLTKHIDLYKNLNSTAKTKMLLLLNNPSAVSASDVKMIPKEIFAVLTAETAHRVATNMNDAVKAEVCTNLTSYNCFIREAIKRNINCLEAILGNGGSLDSTTINDIVDIGEYASWSTSYWTHLVQSYPYILDVDLIRECPIDIITSSLTNLKGFCNSGHLDTSIIRTIIDVTGTDIDQLTTIVQSNWKEFVVDCGGDPNDLKSVFSSTEILTTVALNGSTSAVFEFLEGAGIQAADFSKVMIKNSIKAIIYDPSLLTELDGPTLDDALDEICDEASDMEENDLMKIAEILLNRPNFNEFTSYDSSKLQQMKCLTPFLPKASFDLLPPTAIKALITTSSFKDTTFSSLSQRRTIIEQAEDAFGNSGGFSTDQIKALGSSISAVTTDQINLISPASITIEVVGNFFSNSNGGNPALEIKAVEMCLSADGGGLAALMGTVAAAAISTKTILDADPSTFPGLSGDIEITYQCTRRQARFFMDKAVTLLGEVSADSTQYTPTRLRNLQPMLSAFLPTDITAAVRSSYGCSDIIPIFGNAANINREQMVTLYTEHLLCYGITTSSGTGLVSSLSSNQIAGMAASVLLLHSEDQLENYGSHLCRDICKKMAGVPNTNFITKTELQRSCHFCMKCLGKDVTGDITKDDLDIVGNLKCGVSKSVVERLDIDCLKEHMDYLQNCPLDQDIEMAILARFKNLLNAPLVSAMQGWQKMLLGRFLVYDINSMDTATCALYGSKIIRYFNDRDNAIKARERYGLKMSVTSSEKSLFQSQKEEFVQCVIEGMISTNSGRRKRSTGSLTCTNMRAIGTSGLSGVSEAQLSSLNDQEFIDCADLLGSVTDWTTTQKDALVAVAKRSTVWGEPSTWTSINVYSAGVIIQSMTTTEIDSLTISLDSVGRLGQFDGWSDTKKQSVFNNWLAAEKSSSSSTITSSELRSLGHISCGATTSQIGQISSTVYRDSADAVGEVTSCSESQSYAWALLAKAEYGSDVSTWSTTTISNIGIVIGGLTKSEISTLSSSQIDSIEANDISYIPPSVFSGFTSAQILTFDTAQAQATTTSQRDALDSNQLSALSSIAGIDFTTDSSKAAGVTSSLAVAILLLYLAFSLKNTEV